MAAVEESFGIEMDATEADDMVEDDGRSLLAVDSRLEARR
jgi:hypothetical protein